MDGLGLSFYFKLLRPIEWVKNIFLMAPLFFTPSYVELHTVMVVFFGVFLFCLISSSIYVLNDVVDAEADRLHPIKKKRPVASGCISIQSAIILSVSLAVVALLLAAVINQNFFYIIFIYYLINLAYCFKLKQIALIDIYCIATGFVLRVMAGAILVPVRLSVWMLVCTGLLALFLALAKRRDDCVNEVNQSHRLSMQGYNVVFIDASMIMMLSALFIAYLLYATSSVPILHLHTHHFYWTVPVVLLGMLRYLQLTLVEKKSGAPALLLFQDRFLMLTFLSWIILTSMLIYL